MPSQVLVLKPDTELTFRGPFDRVVTSVLRLRNPTADTVAFKVKTTAPKRYCVRPNSGLLKPGAEMEVAVMLQPSSEPETAEGRSRHKFMVQSLVMPASGGDLEEIWRSTTPDRLMDSKLRVVLADAPEVGGGSGATSTPATQQTRGAAASTTPGTDAASSSPTSLVDGGGGQNAADGKASQAMQAELQRLREENSRLADQELRLRKLAMRPPAESGSQQLQSGGGGGASGGMAVAVPRSPAVPPALFLVLAMVLGLIVGKFLL